MLRCAFVVVLSLVSGLAWTTAREEPPVKKPDLTDPGLEARLLDDSVLRLTLREKTIDIITTYGKMSVPLTEVRRIEFATRVPEDMAKRMEALVEKLGNPEEKVRDEAKNELYRFKLLAMPALQKGANSNDSAIAKLCVELSDKIRDALPDDQIELRKQDIIHTDDMRIAGRIDMTAFKVHTRAFGELSLKLNELRSLTSAGESVDDGSFANAGPGPSTMSALGNNVGQKYAFRVTGVGSGHIWGTDVYTTDSLLAMAAVHAGVVKVGQTGTVRVQIIGQHPNFMGSTRNGVTSHPYNAHPAFKIIK